MLRHVSNQESRLTKRLNLPEKHPRIHAVFDAAILRTNCRSRLCANGAAAALAALNDLVLARAAAAGLIPRCCGLRVVAADASLRRPATRATRATRASWRSR